MYGSLAGIDLSPTGTPRIIVAGDLFDGNGFTFTTENFDAILNFKDLNAFDVILMVKNFLTYLKTYRFWHRISDPLPGRSGERGAGCGCGL